LEHSDPLVDGEYLRWQGPDDPGVDLEVVAEDLGDRLVVFHVMPTALRRNR
jgi:hypothetical protein